MLVWDQNQIHKRNPLEAVMHCPHCGQEHPDMTVFCPVTGKKITADFCANCGAEIQPSWKICPKCGTPVRQPIVTSISGTQDIESGTIQKRTSILIPALFTTVTFSKPEILPGSIPSKVSQEINAVEGGKLILSSNTSVTIPPDSLQKNIQVSMQKTSAESAPALPEGLVGVGSAYLIELGNEPLQQPVTLEISFDPALLPKDVKPSRVFLSYYDENKKEWVFVGGQVDTSRNVIILETTHASWWMPTTWNWQAWIALLSKVLELNYAGTIEAVRVLVDDCPQSGKYVSVDSSQAHNIAQGCVERDEGERPELRIVNPRSFYFEVKLISGGSGYPQPEMLAPGEALRFSAFTSDPSPLVIEANMTQKAGWFMILHMVITMLPGANQLPLEPKQLACIGERLADVSYFAQAATSLFLDQDGTEAANHVRDFLKNEAAVRRLITAADDCKYDPAKTWSLEGARQIAGAFSTILSFTDYTANYFAGNSPARLSFTWASSTPQSEAWIAFLKDIKIWLIHPDGTGLIQVTKNGSENPRVDEFKWSPDGQSLAYSLSSSTATAIWLYDIQTSNSKLLVKDDVRGGFDWSLTGKQIIYDTPSKPSDPWSDKGLWVYNLESEKRRQIVSPSSIFSGFMNPQWSSDGSYALFAIPAFEPAGYGVANFSTGKSIGLPLNPNGGSGAGGCAWAPSELTIACVTETDEHPYKPELRFLDVNGDVIRKLLLPERMNGYASVYWSPDGDRLAISYDQNFIASTEIYSLSTNEFTPIASGYVSDWSSDHQMGNGS
jgi:hypothetical protein